MAANDVGQGRLKEQYSMSVSTVNRSSSWRNAVVSACLLAGVCAGTPVSAQSLSEASHETQSSPEDLTPQTLQFGVYDPEGAFSDSSSLEIEHIFMPWEDIDLSSLDAAGHYVLEKNRELLVTVEPWSWLSPGRSSQTDLRDDILEGRYDGTIQRICTKLADLDSQVTVRWGHEMDIKNGRYPWSDWSPDDFISAYRHFVDTCRARAPEVEFMWSPRGDRDLAAFYPGDAYVDEIGLSVFGLQSYDNLAFGGERDFASLLKPSYDRAKKFKKPVFISEFGCSGDEAYVSRCNDFSAEALKQFPLLKGVVYYSAVEPGEWPASFGKPDWRVRPDAGTIVKPR